MQTRAATASSSSPTRERGKADPEQEYAWSDDLRRTERQSADEPAPRRVDRNLRQCHRSRSGARVLGTVPGRRAGRAASSARLFGENGAGDLGDAAERAGDAGHFGRHDQHLLVRRIGQRSKRLHVFVGDEIIERREVAAGDRLDTVRGRDGLRLRPSARAPRRRGTRLRACPRRPAPSPASCPRRAGSRPAACPRPQGRWRASRARPSSGVPSNR